MTTQISNQRSDPYTGGSEPPNIEAIKSGEQAVLSDSRNVNERQNIAFARSTFRCTLLANTRTLSEDILMENRFSQRGSGPRAQQETTAAIRHGGGGGAKQHTDDKSPIPTGFKQPILAPRAPDQSATSRTTYTHVCCIHDHRYPTGPHLREVSADKGHSRGMAEKSVAVPHAHPPGRSRHGPRFRHLLSHSIPDAPQTDCSTRVSLRSTFALLDHWR